MSTELVMWCHPTNSSSDNPFSYPQTFPASGSFLVSELFESSGRDQIANIRWIMEKAREFQKSIYFCFMDYAKAFDLS